MKATKHGCEQVRETEVYEKLAWSLNLVRIYQKLGFCFQLSSSFSFVQSSFQLHAVSTCSDERYSLEKFTLVDTLCWIVAVERSLLAIIQQRVRQRLLVFSSWKRTLILIYVLISSTQEHSLAFNIKFHKRPTLAANYGLICDSKTFAI